jgi:hypothetical protein
LEYNVRTFSVCVLKSLQSMRASRITSSSTYLTVSVFATFPNLIRTLSLLFWYLAMTSECKAVRTAGCLLE